MTTQGNTPAAQAGNAETCEHENETCPICGYNAGDEYFLEYPDYSPFPPYFVGEYTGVANFCARCGTEWWITPPRR